MIDGDRRAQGGPATRSGHPLEPLLNARSVAVLGAVPRRELAKLASKPITNLLRYGYAGSIYPVNPRYDEVAGLPCYPSLGDIPGPVDCVMVLRRSELAATTISQLGQLGMPAAVVCGGGFAEAGPAGVAAQAQLAEAARAHGVAMCGPNTNGILNFRSGMVLGFHPVLEQDDLVPPGGVSIVSHSGTVTGALMARLGGVGFGYVVSSGNEATVDTADYLDFLCADPETQTVALYLEQIRDGERFVRACRRLREAGKTVVALKAGASDAAAAVAFGHTGSLVGSHSAFLAAARANGVAVAQGLEELVALIRAGNEGRGGSSSVVGLSMSGGLNGLMADAASRTGVDFAPLPAATVGRLREIVPISSPTNPFDLTGLAVDNPGMLGRVLQTLQDGTQAKEFVFSLGLMPDATWPDWSAECADFVRTTGARLSIYAAAGRTPGDGYGAFEALGITVYDAIDPMLRSLAALDTASGQEVDATRSADADDSTCRHPLPPSLPERRRLLEEWGIPYVPYAYVTSVEDAVDAVASMTGPVAMKVASEVVAHKARLGLIALDVAGDAAVRAAFEQIEANFAKVQQEHPEAEFEVEIQQMLPRGGLECFLGGIVDPTFGPLVTVGLGGVMVEAMAEVASALAPLSIAEAEELISSARGLDAALGGSHDRSALTLIVSRFSRMVAAMQSVVQAVECNPVVVYLDDACVVDDLWTGKP